MKRKIFLDYVLMQVAGDQRPYLEINILGLPVIGLLDSGASRTLVGASGYEILKKVGLPLTPSVTKCTVANGQSCSSIGYVVTPISLMNKIRIIDILVVPELPHKLILGIDFWMSMDIVPDLRQSIWHFSENAPPVKINSILTESSLNPSQKNALDKLIANKMELMGTTLGRTHLVSHEIELLPGTKPIKQRYYPVSPAKQNIIDEEIKKMLDDGVIEPCKSPWSSPICLVKKKDDSYRFCVDYRQLNAVTRKDAYPLPLISSILDRLRDAKYLSSLDIKSAYWQVPIAESSRDYTAFTVPNGLYRFRVMPFGLTNAPATWQRLIDSVLCGVDLKSSSVMVYLDDVIIISQDFDSHLETLDKVFNLLHAAGLLVSFDKCQFCRPELKYLGYVVDEIGLRPDPEKIQAILNIPPPRNVKDIRRFIGTASYYRRFVPQFSTIIAPLSNLTKKNVKWCWSPECDTSFRTLKETLVTAPILTCPDFSRTFYVQTDASAYGIGCVLTQFFEDGEKVICYLSRTLTSQERKYSSVERELIAVIWSLEKLRHYVEGFHFKVITDCHSLLWLHRLKDPQGRLARWALRLQPYDFEIIHRKGSDHAVPDFLSRAVPIPVDSVNVPLQDVQDESTTDKYYLRMLNDVRNNPLRYPLWRIHNGNQLYKYVHSKYPELTCPGDDWRLVVPKERRQELIKSLHDSPSCGHAGVYKTVARISSKYYWPKMKADVAKYIRHCETCIRTKPAQKAPAGHMLSKTVTATRPWQIISADIIGPLPRTSKGYSYILVVCDNFSKFVLVFPLRSATASSVVRSIEDHVILMFGAASTIIVDNGVQFKSNLFRTMAKTYNIKIAYTANYHPQSNPTERMNRVVKSMLTAYVSENHKTWDQYLYKIAYAIRSSKHEVTGLTPNFVNFGRETSLDGHCENYVPADSEFPAIDPDNRKLGFAKIYKDVQSRLLKAHQRSTQQYNLRRRPDKFSLHQKVWRRNHVLSDKSKQFAAKLASKFVGPFVISNVVSPWTYELTDSSGKRSIWHIKDLKAHPPDSD